jgi:NAD(P)-dependent dehydrogenase (short-subunit alcohol dehydrogenase family)
MSTKRIAAITGGAKGMGFAAAEALGPDYDLLIADMDEAGLAEAKKTLADKGFKVETAVLNITDRDAVEAFAKRAADLGEIGAVVNAAGIAPKSGNARLVFLVDAVGAAYVQEAFFGYMGEGSVYINFCSSAPYMMPESYIPVDDLRLDPLSEEFLEKNVATIEKNEDPYRSAGFAYTIAKWWVRDWTARSAMLFGKKGARIVSISPGNITTPMYYNDTKESCDKALPFTALGRHGDPAEVGNVIAFLVSTKASFITGVNIQIDGGWISGQMLPPRE